MVFSAFNVTPHIFKIIFKKRLTNKSERSIMRIQLNECLIVYL